MDVHATAEPLYTGGSRHDLFLIHPAGGSIFGYRQLARHSACPASLHAIAFPAGLTPPPVSVEEFAEHYLDAVRAVRPTGPYLLGGHSFGGTVAFEMALRLQRAGERVEGLFLFDSLPPESYRDTPRTHAEALRAAPVLLRSLAPRTRPPAQGDPLPSTIEEAVDLVRLPCWTDVSVRAYEKFLGAWMDHCAALARYRPASAFTGPLTVLAAREPRPEVFALMRVADIPMSHWSAHVDGPVTVHDVDGDHYSMFGRSATVRALAAYFDGVMSGYAELLTA